MQREVVKAEILQSFLFIGLKDYSLMVMFSHVFSAHRGLMWLVSPHNHHNKVSEKVTNSVLRAQTPRNNTVASLSILREQGTPTPLPGPGYQQSQEWGPRRSWDRRSSERARVETVVTSSGGRCECCTGAARGCWHLSEPERRRDVEEDPSWLRLSERWSLQRDRSQWECQCRSCHTCWCRSWTESILSQPWLGNLSPAPAALATHSVASPGSRHHHYLRQWADGSQDIQYTERNLQDKGCN